MAFRISATLTVALLFARCVACGESTGSRAKESAESAPVSPADKADGIWFPTSCGPQTQAAFDRGLFLLHNMMYQQARAEFESAAASDAECAMLHWGIAMTQFHPKWPGEPTEQALRTGAEAVRRARSTAARTDLTEREKGFIEAVGAYYEDWRRHDRNTRREHWRDAHAELAERYPDDAEAQVFFALAQLTTSAPNDFEAQLRAAERLEEVFAARPKHAGVLHYLLHAYDNPAYAHRGTAAAEAYERVAPDAPHALHMPSHIYVRLGNWEPVITWNVRSRDSAERQPVAGDRVSRHFLHALDYLVYAYLQVANDEKAGRERARVNDQTAWQPNSGPAAYALAAVPARFALERSAWKEAAELKPRAVSYNWEAYPWAEAVSHAAEFLARREK